MKKKIQQMVGRFKTAGHKHQHRAASLQKPSPAAPKAQATDDWDMSPQDALQVGIIARYK